MEIRKDTIQPQVTVYERFDAGDGPSSHDVEVCLPYGSNVLYGSAVDLAEYLMDLAARILEAEMVYGEVGVQTQGVATSRDGLDINHPNNAAHVAGLFARNT